MPLMESNTHRANACQASPRFCTEFLDSFITRKSIITAFEAGCSGISLFSKLAIYSFIDSFKGMKRILDLSKRRFAGFWMTKLLAKL